MNVTITTVGQIRFLAAPELQPLCDLGHVTTRRASHVIPQNWLLRLAFRILRTCVPDDSRCAAWTRRWPCQWLADLRISAGPVLGPFGIRQQAIAAEIDWLTQHGF